MREVKVYKVNSIDNINNFVIFICKKCNSDIGIKRYN